MTRVLAKDLTKPRSKAISTIETGAAQARSNVTTLTDGQDLIYSLKASEARRFLVRYPTEEIADRRLKEPKHYPFLNNEVGITAPTIWRVADLIHQKAHIWLQHALAIERARLTARAAVRAGKNEAEITKALNINWESIS